MSSTILCPSLWKATYKSVDVLVEMASKRSAFCTTDIKIGNFLITLLLATKPQLELERKKTFMRFTLFSSTVRSPTCAGERCSYNSSEKNLTEVTATVNATTARMVFRSLIKTRPPKR